MNNIKKKKNKLATMYFFKLKDLEKELGTERKNRKTAETELEKIKRENEELKGKIKELEE